MMGRSGRARWWQSTIALTLILITCGCSEPELANTDDPSTDAQSSHDPNVPVQDVPEQTLVVQGNGPQDPQPLDSTQSGLASEWSMQIQSIAAGDSYAFRTSLPSSSELIDELTALDGELEDLLLDGGGLRPEDFEKIASIESLIHLRIRLQPLKDDALEMLSAGLKQVEILNLPAAQVSSEGLRGLVALPKLRQLRLGGELVDDAAMEVLAGCENLQSLHLIGPKITAKGLKHLESASRLSSLYIDDCHLPDSAWESMFAAKPSLHVHIDQHHHDRDPSADGH